MEKLYMPKNMTVYDLLISCPSDVNKYVQVIEKIISDFNSMYGEINNSLIVAKHWKKNSYAESGGKPQDLLNKQIVLDSDVAVALFWTKFGTPTEKFTSGTEEEIELLLEQNKQVFMYFLDAPTIPSEIDQEQYEKVKNFQKKYADRGIYSVIHEEDEFKKKFTNDLARYFMPIIMGVDIENKHSNLLIDDAYSNEKSVSVNNFELRNGEIIKGTLEECEKLIKSIDEIPLISKRLANSTNLTSDLTSDLRNTVFGNQQSHPVIIPDEFKKTLNAFFESQKIEMMDTFFEIGGLTESKNFAALSTISGSEYIYHGTQNEEKKYDLIKKLYWKIKKYNEYVSFFGLVDNYSFISCALVNEGTSFDEDIDVKFYFPKNSVISPSQFPIPEENIIKELDDIDFLKHLLHLSVTDTTIGFDNYPSAIPKYIPQDMGLFTSQKDYDDFKIEYIDDLKRIMCFEVFKNEEYDVFRFKIRYLKQHAKMLFPSKVFLNNNSFRIKYEISSKYSPDVIEGDLIIEQQKSNIPD